MPFISKKSELFVKFLHDLVKSSTLKVISFNKEDISLPESLEYFSQLLISLVTLPIFSYNETCLFLL